MTRHASADHPGLEQTRSAVLNVVVASGMGIAAGGLLLRFAGHRAPWHAPRPLRQAMMAGLVGLAVASYVTRRLASGRGDRGDPARRARRFYRGHVLAALLAAAAVPLGLAYGWLERPELDAVGPFWIAAVALGLLALPRAREYEGFDDDGPGPGESEPTS